MPSIAYIANQFPSPLEPYVMEEIQELRRRGINVIACSARLADEGIGEEQDLFASETLYLEPLRFRTLVSAAWLCVKRRKVMVDLAKRVILHGNESPSRRIRALLHSWLGAYYAVLLWGRGVQHIHAHHGYFASWVAMVAARLLGISFSVTLHGSDLLLHPRYLETKLEHCKFCITVSEFNRQHILERYPECDPGKILLRRLGVSPVEKPRAGLEDITPYAGLAMLAVGRLHPVKNYAFLLRACRLLKDRGFSFTLQIAGEGIERPALESLIGRLGLETEVRLRGHLSQDRLRECYEKAAMVVLTSHSEGVPVALMEAMAHGKTVLAPDITGIPELVCDGQTGLLYRSGSLEDFASRVELIGKSQSALGPMRDAARQHVLRHFNREKNLAGFAESFVRLVGEQ